MRIISGQHRGRQIRAPRWPDVRPTTDYAKTGLFNLLRSRIRMEGLAVLDLFGGTGNITYEFLSRGAGRVVCVDDDARHVRFIRATAVALGYGNCTVVRQEALKFLTACADPFGLVFADPPFGFARYRDLLDAAFRGKAVGPDAWFVLEHEARNHYNEHPNFVFERRYGHAAFSFFRTAAGSLSSKPS